MNRLPRASHRTLVTGNPINLAQNQEIRPGALLDPPLPVLMRWLGNGDAWAFTVCMIGAFVMLADGWLF